MQKVHQRQFDDWTLRTFFYIPWTLYGFLCSFAQAEYPYLLVALAVSINVPPAFVCTQLQTKEKAQTTTISLTKVSTTLCNLWMKPTLIAQLQQSHSLARWVLLLRCWFGERIWANMSFQVALGYNAPIRKLGAKVVNKVKQLQKLSTFFDLFTNFAWFSRKTPSKTQKLAQKIVGCKV